MNQTLSVTIWAQAYQFVYASVLAVAVSAVHGLWPGLIESSLRLVQFTALRP